jgi:hypothetical protein
MSKPRKRYWRLKLIAHNQYYAELDGGRSEYVNAAHCKACAIVGLILKYGGDADLRGMHKYGHCYQMLAITARAGREPEDDDDRTS